MGLQSREHQSRARRRSRRIEQLVALASRHAIPTIYFLHEFVAAAG
jgi:hypothetical protein